MDWDIDMCETVCHEGPCKRCDVREMAKCYCGSVQKEIGCGEGEQVTCIDGGKDNNWVGRFPAVKFPAAYTPTRSIF